MRVVTNWTAENLETPHEQREIKNHQNSARHGEQSEWFAYVHARDDTNDLGQACRTVDS